MISKKYVYSKNYFMQRTTKHIEDYKKKREAKTEEKKKKLNTKKKRAKEQRERFTRCESPNPRPIKKGTRKKSKQLVIRSI